MDDHVSEKFENSDGSYSEVGENVESFVKINFVANWISCALPANCITLELQNKNPHPG